MKKIIVLLTAVLLIALVWFFALSLNVPKISNVKTQEGKGLPSGFELLKLNGEKVDETELNKGMVLLNVWASWCITCLVEHPFLNELSDTITLM